MSRKRGNPHSTAINGVPGCSAMPVSAVSRSRGCWRNTGRSRNRDKHQTSTGRRGSACVPEGGSRFPANRPALPPDDRGVFATLVLVPGADAVPGNNTARGPLVLADGRSQSANFLQKPLERALDIAIGQLIRRIRLWSVGRDGMQGGLPVAGRENDTATIEYAGLEAQYGRVDPGLNRTNRRPAVLPITCCSLRHSGQPGFADGSATRDGLHSALAGDGYSGHPAGVQAAAARAVVRP